MNKRLTKKTVLLFDSLRRVDEDGNEYWSSRDLATALTYVDYRNFLAVINKAKQACENSKQIVQNHFVDTNEMVLIGSNTERQVDTTHMTRYACYLVVQNADPSKAIVAQAQTYFAIQTRLSELHQAEEAGKLTTEEERRQANAAHYQVGAKVRQTIRELGGTMPEDLPVAESIKILESKQRKQLKQQEQIDNN